MNLIISTASKLRQGHFNHLEHSTKHETSTRGCFEGVVAGLQVLQEFIDIELMYAVLLHSPHTLGWFLKLLFGKARLRVSSREDENIDFYLNLG